MRRFWQRARGSVRNCMMLAVYLLCVAGCSWMLHASWRGFIAVEVTSVVMSLILPTNEMWFHPFQKFFSEGNNG